MGRRCYKYYQPNKKDLKDKYGDCQIRALSKVLNKSWIETYDLTVPINRKFQINGMFNLPVKERAEALKLLGFEYYGISVRSGNKRPTVEEFAKEHKTGSYILNVAHHEVACVDGIYYDTWDSGKCSLYGYFEYKK